MATWNVTNNRTLYTIKKTFLDTFIVLLTEEGWFYCGLIDLLKLKCWKWCCQRSYMVQQQILLYNFLIHNPSFFVFFFFRKPSKKKRKSTKNEEEQANDLPPITFKGGRKGFNLSESLRGYHSFTDEEESEQRRKNDQRGLPNFNRKGSYQRLSGEKDVELVDGMLEDSPEKDRKKSGKKKRRRSKGNDDDVVS